MSSMRRGAGRQSSMRILPVPHMRVQYESGLCGMKSLLNAVSRAVGNRILALTRSWLSLVPSSC